MNTDYDAPTRTRTITAGRDWHVPRTPRARLFFEHLADGGMSYDCDTCMELLQCTGITKKGLRCKNPIFNGWAMPIGWAGVPGVHEPAAPPATWQQLEEGQCYLHWDAS